MADNDLNDAELATFFNDAKAAQENDVPILLTERVLADAAKIGAQHGALKNTAHAAKPQNWINRLFAPIGGAGGAFALGAFASIGFFIGLGDADILYNLPVMGDILTTFSDELGSISPVDTLDYLMAEG